MTLDDNAQLNAAAPDLLAALRAMMVAMYDGGTRQHCCPTVIAKLALADSAIAKAEGK